MKIFGDGMNFRAALAGLLPGTVMQSACIGMGEGADGEGGDSPAGAPGSLQTKPDLNIPAAVPRPGVVAGKAPPAAKGADATAVDAETQPPAPPQACTEAGARCAGGICAVAADGQLGCKLADGAVCAADDQCASGSCGPIVVPPDPSDPYDLGYTYVGCK